MSLLKDDSAVLTAKVSEMFVSYQGEGPYAGSRQLFLRFYGCNRTCVYCDTPQKSYKTFTKDGLIGKILDFGGDYNELSLTGGEPLLHADFLEVFIGLYKKHNKNRIYLETNGTLPDNLKKVVNYIDIVAMDFKLPSSTQEKFEEDIWQTHKEFAEIASRKELFVKIIVTDSTDIDDVVKAAGIIKNCSTDISVVLQPVTSIPGRVKAPDSELMLYFTRYMEKETRKNVMVLGQMHKRLGIR